MAHCDRCKGGDGTREHNAQCVHREGDDIYNGDADAEEPDEGDKKRKKKV